MHRKPFYSIVLIICSIILLCACNHKAEIPTSDINPSSSPNDVTISFNISPDSYTMTQEICMPNRHQFSYTDNYNHRFVIELLLENSDKSNIPKEDLLVRNSTGKTYIYNGEFIEYEQLNESMILGMLKIQKNDCVIEWSQSGYFCRIFGNLEANELLNIAESVVIISNE
ncbi:MAG: DUF4367 domain-containing protein [Schaedlerella sp.]|nr:DUF4367 domain-containing protein [Schaedlerella sp.]